MTKFPQNCAAGIFTLLAAVHGLAQGLPKPPTSPAFGAVSIPPVETAFRASVGRVQSGAIEIDVGQIPGTYLYRDKFKLSTTARTIRLGALELPPGVQIDDETFGKVDVYRGAQVVRVPYTGQGKAELTLTLQGCHEIAKICYPPYGVKLSVTAPMSNLGTVGNVAPSAKAPDQTPLKSPAFTVNSVEKLDAGIRAAKGKWVMVDLWATWCAPCKWMEKHTLADTNVSARLSQEFIVIKADVTKSGAASAGLLKRYGLPGPPGFIFYGKDGKEITGARLMGTLPPEKFLSHLTLVTS